MNRTLNLTFIVVLVGLVVSCHNKETTTFYLVRHAEKVESNTMQDPNEDPPLTREGEQRAQRLKDLLSDNNISAIYSTQYQRNINTVKPLSELKEIEISYYEWHNWQSIMDESLKKYSGGTIVVCGHGDNLLPMITYLGGKKPQNQLAKHEYDKIFQVKYGKDSILVKTLTY